MFKVVLFSIVASSFVALHSHAQCELITFNFSSQSDVDAFPAMYPGCTTIGGITVMGDVQNLYGLQQIEEVLGNVIISSSAWASSPFPLTDIEGLDNIVSVGGYVSIGECPNLEANTIFNNLQYIGGYLGINSGAPAQLFGFPNLDFIGGTFQVAYTNLAELSICNGLQSVGGVYITNNSMLSTITSFSSLTQCNGLFSLSDNPLLMNPGVFNALETMPNGMQIMNCDGMTDLNGMGNIEMLGSLVIYGCDQLQSLSGLAIGSCTGTFSLSNNLQLHDITSLNTLNSFHSIAITGNPALNDLNGLNGLNPYQTGASISIQNNVSLMDCRTDALCGIVQVGLVPVNLGQNGGSACNSTQQLLSLCLTPTSSQLASFDFNADGNINTLDLLEILPAIGCVNDCPSYDFDGDGIVGVADLQVFLQNVY